MRNSSKIAGTSPPARCYSCGGCGCNQPRARSVVAASVAAAVAAGAAAPVLLRGTEGALLRVPATRREVATPGPLVLVVLLPAVVLASVPPALRVALRLGVLLLGRGDLLHALLLLHRLARCRARGDGRGGAGIRRGCLAVRQRLRDAR